ncbi:JHBP [Nesidiocoris tenuis]|uniref:JHBP n=1 Tax=Nesidiocoris tenuis TaxID=355587 RepID=A0ABN7B4F8_9HEMI|nr:JHBP [Nesidiocoris tenuis]
MESLSILCRGPVLLQFNVSQRINMPGWFVLVLTLVMSANEIVSAKEIPDYLHVCHRSDPQLSVCITRSVESLRDRLIAGLPELGVPSIEPLVMEEPISTQGAGLVVTTKDLVAYGGGNFSIKNLLVDMNNLKFKFQLGFPHLAIEGKYSVDGKIIMIPIKGDGDVKCDVSRVDGFVELTGNVEQIDGMSQMRFTDMKIDVTVQDGKIHLSNLFGGDKLIGEVVNAAINLNFQYFVKELKPIIQDTLSTFILKSANKICDGLNYDELAPL